MSKVLISGFEKITQQILVTSMQLVVDVINVATRFLKVHYVIFTDVNRILVGNDDNDRVKDSTAAVQFEPHSFEEARNLWELPCDAWVP